MKKKQKSPEQKANRLIIESTMMIIFTIIIGTITYNKGILTKNLIIIYGIMLTVLIIVWILSIMAVVKHKKK